MNVLSLFDGMSCGQIALNRIGIKYDNYFAAEIKPHAIKVTKHNYPDTIHLGDVTKIDFASLPKINVLIGGSPCQDFSRANKSRKGLRGDKSSLFYYYLKALDVCKPKYFLLENVIMESDQCHIINTELDCVPVRINSSLVSAQLRDRLYWTNIPGDGVPDFFGSSIEQPEDKGILFQDILTSGKVKRTKSHCILSNDHKNISRSGKDTVSQNYFKKRMKTGFGSFVMDDELYRHTNKKERSRLQTVPENYMDCLDSKDAFCLLGDGWTIDVICHILKGIK